MLCSLHFVLLASIAVCSYSYSIPREQIHFEQVIPEIRNTKNIADFVYPQEYVDKLFAALSPEEQKNLTSSTIDVGQRGSEDSDTDKHNCSLHLANDRPQLLQAVDDFEFYIVVQTASLIQEYSVQVCDWDYTCNVKFTRGESGCCRYIEESIDMIVLSVPYTYDEKRTAKVSSEDKFIKKPLYLRTKCSCVSFRQNMNEINRKPNCNLTKRL